MTIKTLQLAAFTALLFSAGSAFGVEPIHEFRLERYFFTWPARPSVAVLNSAAEVRWLDRKFANRDCKQAQENYPEFEMTECLTDTLAREGIDAVLRGTHRMEIKVPRIDWATQSLIVLSMGLEPNSGPFPVMDEVRVADQALFVSAHRESQGAHVMVEGYPTLIWVVNKVRVKRVRLSFNRNERQAMELIH